MRIYIVAGFVAFLFLTACESTSTKTTTPGSSAPAPKPQERPLDLLSGSTSYRSPSRTMVEQYFASLSVGQINAAKVSQIDFPESVRIPSEFKTTVEVEYEKSNSSGTAKEIFPAYLAGQTKIEGTKLILPGLRFNIPAEVGSNSRKQTLRVSAGDLQVVIPLKTPRLKFCTSPLVAETKWSGSHSDNQSHMYRKQVKDFTLENMVLCGLTIEALELHAVSLGGQRLDLVNPIGALGIENPEIEIWLDGKLQDFGDQTPQYDGSVIKLEFPMRFADLAADFMEVRALDPNNRSRFVSFGIPIGSKE